MQLIRIKQWILFKDSQIKKDVILLLVDTEKVSSPIKYESSRSGRPGLFPHIYGSLNIDSIYKTLELTGKR